MWNFQNSVAIITQPFLVICISNTIFQGFMYGSHQEVTLKPEAVSIPEDNVPPSHTCMYFVSRMCSCNHPCCKEWCIKAGMKCGFIKKIEGSSPGVTQYIIREDINATTVSETNALSLSQISSPLLPAASRKWSRTTSTGGYSAKRKKGQPKPKSQANVRSRVPNTHLNVHTQAPVVLLLLPVYNQGTLNHMSFMEQLHSTKLFYSRESLHLFIQRHFRKEEFGLCLPI